MLLMIGIGLLGEFERLFYGAREFKNMKEKDKRKITKQINTIKNFFCYFLVCVWQKKGEKGTTQFGLRIQLSIENQRKCVC